MLKKIEIGKIYKLTKPFHLPRQAPAKRGEIFLILNIVTIPSKRVANSDETHIEFYYDNTIHKTWDYDDYFLKYFEEIIC